MKKRAIVAILMAMVMLLALAAGCTTKPAAEQAGEKLRTTSGNKATNSMSHAIAGQVNSLDPQLYISTQESQVVYQVYEPLFIMDNEDNMMLTLAEEVTPDETGSSVAITLKSGIKFHNGETLTAEDVAYTLSRCENSPVCSDLYLYSAIEVVDDTHLVWNFPHAAEGAGFNELIWSAVTMEIVSKSFCESVLSAPTENLNLVANGTGPYKLDNIASNGDITLKRFEDYHGTASLDTIYFKVVTGSMAMAFESGDIDLARYDAVAFEEIKKYDNVDTETVMINNVMFIMNNCSENSALGDKTVREAAVRAVNRLDAGMAMTDGNAYPAYNMATPLVDFYADVCEHYDMDLEKSKSLLAQAGYSESNRCPINLLTINDPLWVACTEVLKANLEQSYFTVDIEELADPTRLYIGDFDMALMAIGLTNSFTSYAVLFDDASGLNMSSISGPERDEVLAKILAAGDEASAQEAMKAVVDTLAYVPLTYLASSFAYDADLNHGEFYTALSSFLFQEFSWKN